jgi:hypothetical protein
VFYLQGFLFVLGLVGLAHPVVEPKDEEAGADQHDEEAHYFEGDLSLLFQGQRNDHLQVHVADLARLSCWALCGCNRSSSSGNLFVDNLAGGGHFNDFLGKPRVGVGNFDGCLLSSVVDVLVNGHAVVILGGRLASDLLPSQVELEVEVREHLLVLEACIWPHLLNLSLVQEGLLEFLEEFLNRRLVFFLPGGLTRLFFSHGLMEYAREVILVDHLGEIFNNFLFETRCLFGVGACKVALDGLAGRH